MRMHGTKFLGASVHDLRKRFHAARVIPRQTSRNVIWTFHQQRPQEIDALISIACLDVQLHWVGHCIHWLDSDRPVQKTALRDNESCQQFLRARCRSYLVRRFFRTILCRCLRRPRSRRLRWSSVFLARVYSVGAGIDSSVSFAFARFRCDEA